MAKGDVFTAPGALRAVRGGSFHRVLLCTGLKIQGGIHRENEDRSEVMVAEITKVTPGSIADNSGQLQIGTFLSKKEKTRRFFSLMRLFFSGDQVLEWNGQKLTNLNYNDVYRIISQHSMQSPDIHMIVRRPLR
jgi:hypothetical protein